MTLSVWKSEPFLSRAEALKQSEGMLHIFAMFGPSVVRTESWLNDKIRDDDVFPANYTYYGKDRNGHGAGVFILVKSDIVSSKLDVVVGACEPVWCNSSWQIRSY